MTDQSADDEWIDIDEAVRLTGMTTRTLRRWKTDNKVETKVVTTEFQQPQRRTLFKKSTLPLAQS